VHVNANTRRFPNWNLSNWVSIVERACWFNKAGNRRRDALDCRYSPSFTNRHDQ